MVIGFEVCLCPDPNHIKKIDSKYNDSELTRCCPKTLLTFNPTSSSQNVTCPLQVDSDPEPGLFCPHSYFETYDAFDVSNGDMEIPQCCLVRIKSQKRVRNVTLLLGT